MNAPPPPPLPFAHQGSKGQEGELFGIQNLLKFSDDSLLKALRRKYAAQASGAAVAGGAKAKGGDGDGSPVGVVRDDGKTKRVLAPEDVMAVSDSNSTRSMKRIGGRELRGAKVDTADEAELVSAVREVVGRAQDNGKPKPLRGGTLFIEECRV